MRTAPTVLVLFLFVLMLTTLISYSVNVPIVSVNPVAVKPAMTYFLDKNNLLLDRNEVRSVSLSLSGTTVISATLVFYKRTSGTYNVRTTVSLLDADGNVISEGTECASYLGTGSRTVIVSFAPAVSVDDVHSVRTTIEVVTLCI